MRERTFDERLEAARLGRARHPFYVVVNFGVGYSAGQMVSGALSAFEYAVPLHAAKFDFPIYAVMTDAGSNTAYYEILRNAYTQDGLSVKRFFGNSQKLTLAAGETLAGGGRQVPAEWFYLPNPTIIHEGEYLRMKAEQAGFGSSGKSGSGSFIVQEVDISESRAVFLSELILKEDAEEGKLTTDELDEIILQIQTRRQRTYVLFLDVDYSDESTYLNVALPELEEWGLIEAFASGTPTGGAANFIQHSLITIKDPNGKEWSNDNEGIPVGALCAFPFDANNKQVIWRKLLTSYLVAPRRENLTFSFEQRLGLGEDTTGKIAILIRTI